MKKRKHRTPPEVLIARAMKKETKQKVLFKEKE